MRTTIAALLAFAAGVLLMLLLPGRTARVPLSAPALAAAASTMQPTGSNDSTAPLPVTNTLSDDDAWRDWPRQDPTPEQVVYDQSAMVDRALAHLGPRVPGRPNLYLITFAGDGGEDVFRNEAEYAAKLFTRRFGPSTHALVLENNPASLESHPLADWSNLEYALDGLARIMKPDDILMLYLTSHGSEDHQLLVDMDPLPLDQIGANDLPGILREHHFKWKVVVVNACYSGGFIPPLRGPDTLVLTAASADRSSFGCGSESNITYFGHAWLVDALNRTDNFVTAFQQARSEIARWETQDKLTPSDPQIYAGKNIAAELARWRRGVTAGPAVRFDPTLPAAAASAR